MILLSSRPSCRSQEPGVVNHAFCWLVPVVTDVQSRRNKLVATECVQFVVVVLCSGSKKKSRGYVCAIAELEDTGLELLFVLIPPCMSHNNNKTECK